MSERPVVTLPPDEKLRLIMNQTAHSGIRRIQQTSMVDALSP